MGTESIKYKLEKMGYSLHEIDSDVNVEELIIDILKDFKKTGNPRLIKSIPFIIYQSSPANGGDDKPKIDLGKLREMSEGNGLSVELNTMLYYTKEIYKKLGIAEKWIIKMDEFIGKFSNEQERGAFRKHWNVEEAELREDLRHEFLMQKRINELEGKGYLIDKMRISEERDMNYYLSTLFTPKQREIIQKIMNGETLTKTEYEYYIRIIKKRLEAISELKDLAETAAKKKPKKML